ncbi:MAG: membrane protein insertase YidC [Terriglobales bacterium]
MAEFKNPQQDPGSERRLLLVFVLTFVVILIAQPLLKRYLPQPPAQPAPIQQQAQNPVPTSPPASAQAAVTTPATFAGAATKQARAESETVVENDLYRITFTNRGAQVKSWILKKYDDDSGRPLDLVNPAASALYGYPLSLWTYDETQRNQLNSALYVPSVTGTVTVPGDVTFEYSAQNLAVKKTFHFDGSYVIGVQTSVFAGSSPVTAYPMWPAGLGDQNNSIGFHASQIEFQNNDKTTQLAIKKISGGGTQHGPFNWAGVGDSYFAAVFVPENPQSAVLVTLRNALQIPKDPIKPKEGLTPVDVLGVAVGDSAGITNARLYAGPKSLDVLQSVTVPTILGAEQDLRSLINFGTFGIIARPLFAWLRWTYKYVHNWGWAIVLQTLVITLALLPLRISSMKSALKMQKVQPQMNAIKDKYKKYSMRDPRRQEMNVEIGALMKQEGVSPLGGCLPLIIQLPFIWAYYKMLGVLIDLRHAHWLWVSDLSSKDPYFILPVLLVVSMVITQRMTPQTGMDPAQQKMMNITMPLMMGFIFFNLAAGLNLYYAESNLITIIQQAVMNRTSLGREMRELALKRARKKQQK